MYNLYFNDFQLSFFIQFELKFIADIGTYWMKQQTTYTFYITR